MEPGRLVLDSVVRVAGRTAATVHRDMKRAVDSLASIAAVAPLLGFLIVLEGIASSFVGCGGEKWTCLAAGVERLANAIARGTLGLLVGIVSSMCYQHLQRRLAEAGMELRCAILELANSLAVLPRQQQ